MHQIKSDLKVFVSDEILDFRTLEGRQKGNSSTTTSSKECSTNVINFDEGEPPNERQLSSLEKFSKTLYGTSSSVTHQRLTKKSKQKTRIRSVDPRFRRSRSPNKKPTTTSQSTTNLSEVSQSQVGKKSHSASLLQISSQENSKPLQNKGNRNTQENIKVVEKAMSVISSKKNVLKSNEIGIKPPHTDSMDVNNIEMEVETNSVLSDNNEENPGTSISPYWNDPRLLAKHRVLRKARLRRFGSSMTCPIIPRSSNVSSNNCILCHNCLYQLSSPHQRNATGCGADNILQAHADTPVAHPENLKQLKAEEYSGFAFFMALGSITGILVVSVIGWLIFSQFSMDLSKYIWLSERVPEESSFMLGIKSMRTSFAQGVDFIFNKLYQLFTLTRADVLSPDSTGYEPFHVWWKNFM